MNLHHIGFVVRSIADTADRFTATLPLIWNREIFYDPVQTVRVTFLASQHESEPMLELIEPASDHSRVTRFLERGGGLRHLRYEVDSVRSQIDLSLAAGAITVQEPTPAVAFEGRYIA
jgi:methylmalonyl-CoA/ethylmalonyl-CoA epimerase